MKKVISFIVNKRYFILAAMLALATLCAICIPSVTINEDMTEYLPDDSGMRQGLDIMNEAFPETETTNGIRVMFTDLADSDIATIKSRLEKIDNVDSVSYDTTEKYNKDNHTLFLLNMSCDYGSEEESVITEALKADFSEYEMCYRSNDVSGAGIPTWVLLLALTMLVIILFAMCGSWFEPLLFLSVIGIAVVINLGTNIALGSIGTITASIAAILQLVLSMDYSIMLMNRYRQERRTTESKTEAMKTALQMSFGSISSSSLTTVVGLLMLCFMSFGIGLELGIVLAKGVFISLVCVFTILPTLIILCDKIIAKTEKKRKHNTVSGKKKPSFSSGMAAFAKKSRYAMMAVFVLLFVGMSILQSYTPINFTQNTDDPIADTFPQKNMLVMIYDNKDEEKIAELIERLEKNENVTQVMSYPNLLGKPYTADELGASIGDLGSSMGADTGDMPEFDPALLSLVYYHYYDGQTKPLTMSDFLQFLSNDILNNDTFADAISPEMREQADMLGQFSSKEALQTQRTAAELAAMFDIDETMINTVLRLYHGGDVSGKTMTLVQFADFLSNDLLADPMFADSFDDETKGQLVYMNGLIQCAASANPLTPAQMSAMLGMSEDETAQLYFLYLSQNDTAFQQEMAAMTMKLTDFVALARAQSNNPQLAQMEQLIGVAVSGRTLGAAELAGITGMSEPEVSGIFMAAGGVTSMTLPDFLNATVTLAPTNQQLQQLNQIVQLAVSGAPLDAQTLATVFGMEVTQVYQLFGLSLAPQKTITLSAFTNFLVNTVLTNESYAAGFDEATKAQLTTLNQMVQAAASGAGLNTAALSSTFGMDESMTALIFRLYYGGDVTGKTMSMEQLVNFLKSDILTNPAFADKLDASTAELLMGAGTIIDAVVSEKAYTAAEAHQLLGTLTDDLDENMVEMLYFYYAGQHYSNAEWTMSIDGLFEHLTSSVLEDTRFASFIDEDMRQELMSVKTELKDGIAMLKSDTYSRMMISTTLPEESDKTTVFISELNESCKGFEGEYYLIGNSAMHYEMGESFDSELLLITILTIVSIFLIVALTFRNVAIPTILVLLVQCAVYITVSVFHAPGVYYLALLIVECILMGATIDYAILFTSYYREYRETMEQEDAVKNAYKGAIHTILTSGLILVLVPGAIGLLSSGTMSEVCLAISIGSLSAVSLILLVLPALLIVFDKVVARKRKSKTE